MSLPAHFLSSRAAVANFLACASSSAAAQALQRASVVARARAAHSFVFIPTPFSALLGAHSSSPAWVADSPIRAGAGVCPQEVT